MSRDPRDDESRDDSSRDAVRRLDPETRQAPEPARADRADRIARARAERPWSPSQRLTLPRSETRQPVALGRSRYMLRESEVELLSTVGAFRAVQVSDLEGLRAPQSGRNENHTQADIRSLREQGLLQTHSLVINGRPEHVAVLTGKGRQLLERARFSRGRDDPSDQQFYAGLVKPRELAHDAQLYRMSETERTQLHAQRAAVTRVVLDYELKADYHTYVHEQQQAGVDRDDARRAFAREHDLPFAGGRIHFPDVRIEYTSADGRSEHRDLELVTEHYSRSQLSGKQTAGFRVYRAAGAGSRRGGTPSDPHHLEWLS